MTKKISIVIATHKEYKIPEESIYIPLQVGAKGKESILNYKRDDIGENISDLNSSFCELTGLYWAWKNIDAEYVGLAHYRRHFSLKRKGRQPFENILLDGELEELTRKYKIILPKKRNYYIETLYSHYKHTHYSEQLDETREVVREKYPLYLESFDKVMNQRSGYMFNMMVMEKQYLDEYCTWLFDILFELKERIGDQELSFFQGRFYGRVSEIIFNVWLDQKIKSGEIALNEIKEINHLHMEKINWFKKGTAFLSAKFLRKRYSGSF